MTTSQSRIPTHTLSDDWHIASVALHLRSENQMNLRRWLGGWTGVEIHAEDDRGKMVVVMEVQDPQSILDLIDEASEQAGVLNAALVYHEVIPMKEASL